MNYKLIGITFLLLLTTQLSAQKKETNSSFSLSDLNGSAIYLEYNYDSLKIEGEKELEYKARMSSKKGKKIKEWLMALDSSNYQLYQNVFLDGFLHSLKQKTNISLTEQNKASYILEIRIDLIERDPLGIAAINITVIVKDKISNKQLCVYEVKEAQGLGLVQDYYSRFTQKMNIYNAFLTGGVFLANSFNDANKKKQVK
jgi:hypothetical protein